MTDNNRSAVFGGQDVAVFIDFENIYISVLAEYDVNPDFESIIEKASEFGRVSVAQAYADWTPYSHYINALHAYEIDPIYVPAYHYGEGGKQKGGAIKNSVDMFLCINAMKMLYSHANIQTFVLITGDRDFVPLVKTIREFGKRAVVIGVAGASSAHLAQAADEFFFYHQITDNLKPPEKEKPKARDPYETVVEAVKLARQRGYVATLASLKLLMSELMEDFDSAKFKDPRGRPLAKFKDFVKEAERRGKVKLFSTGTINEVFLPNEDPKKSSRFVEEVITPSEPAAEGEVEETAEGEEESKVEVEVSETQWKMFANAMVPIEGAVPFVRVFDVLRGLRNQGLLDLSNRELKGMVIKAIHMGLLIRSNRGRGRRTFYQLTSDTNVLGKYVELPPGTLMTEPATEAGLPPENPGESVAQSVELQFADLAAPPPSEAAQEAHAAEMPVTDVTERVQEDAQAREANHSAPRYVTFEMPAAEHREPGSFTSFAPFGEPPATDKPAAEAPAEQPAEEPAPSDDAPAA